MKKLILSISAILFAVYSHAVSLSTTGTGQVLIFPYYTVNENYKTAIKLINTTDRAKALRVRFREAANNREVFTFNLYMGPNDVWSGTLNKGNFLQGFFTEINSVDKSCTLPSIGSSGVLFNNTKFTNTFVDGYGTDVKRMHEGFIEVIEMGVLTGGSAQATLINQSQPNANCALLQGAWDVNSANSYWLANPNADMLPPSGGVTGDVSLIDVLNGTEIKQQATALGDFSGSILHFNIDNDSPSLADAKPVSINYGVNGQKQTLNWPTGIEAVSSVLMKSTIDNEYELDASTNVSNDWIITLPTRQYHTDPVYAVTSLPLKPFVANSVNGITCENYNVTDIFDREEGITPGFPQSSTFCYGINNLSLLKDMNNNAVPIGVFSSNFPAVILDNGNLVGNHAITSFSQGWAALMMQQSLENTSLGLSLVGLPFVGFSAQGFSKNNITSNVLNNYAHAIGHKSTTTITPIIKNSASEINGIPLINPMHIAKDNVGQVLIYPYYTVKNNFNTYLSVVNTTNQVKSIKIHFREGLNARLALSFNIYLGPYDVWTSTLEAAVATSNFSPGHEGEPTVKLLISDTSCTAPMVMNGYEFVPYGYDPMNNGDPNDGYDQQGTNLERTQEGFVEIFEMGIVTGVDATAIMHNAGVPNDCQKIADNWGLDGQWVNNPIVNMLEPDGSGGLIGSARIVDVNTGVAMSYDATAIVNFTTSLSHSSPGGTSTNLSSGDNYTTLIDAQSGSVQTTWSTTIDAVSALFMQAQTLNDYDLEDNKQSEWINTYPTKQFYVDELNTASVPPIMPFIQALVADIGACEDHRFHAYDKDQKINTPLMAVPVPDPLPPNYSELPEDCWSVNVSDVNNGIDNNTILASTKGINDYNNDPLYTSINDLPFSSGWMLKSFESETNNPSKLVGIGLYGSLHEIYGKPVLGFVVQDSFKDTNDGVGTFAHYTTLKMNQGVRKIIIFDELFSDGFE